MPHPIKRVRHIDFFIRNGGMSGKLAAAAFVFSSCVDKDYDLNNGITSEGTLLENLAAPIGNIEKITLDKLLFSESGSDNGISYNQDGDLYLDFAGSRSYMTVGVK